MIYFGIKKKPYNWEASPNYRVECQWDVWALRTGIQNCNYLTSSSASRDFAGWIIDQTIKCYHGDSKIPPKKNHIQIFNHFNNNDI